ncbi:hypothetical protein LQR31_10050 [Chromobacterium vaccinii]|uniref:hypothetical protein n=1 Tax=Chromobacterium vaccinii TaxID=1108595 RepID=UPI001E44F454|nr:hypothetical protein [Chromobacterium vaccinii]MCD4484814.1 hypothetical protein [Chromobacterium vaccinii]
MSLVFVLYGDILSGTVKCKPVVTSKGIVFQPFVTARRHGRRATRHLIQITSPFFGPMGQLPAPLVYGLVLKMRFVSILEPASGHGRAGSATTGGKP